MNNEQKVEMVEAAFRLAMTREFQNLNRIRVETGYAADMRTIDNLQSVVLGVKNLLDHRSVSRPGLDFLPDKIQQTLREVAPELAVMRLLRPGVIEEIQHRLATETAIPWEGDDDDGAEETGAAGAAGGGGSCAASGCGSEPAAAESSTGYPGRIGSCTLRAGGGDGFADVDDAKRRADAGAGGATADAGGCGAAAGPAGRQSGREDAADVNDQFGRLMEFLPARLLVAAMVLPSGTDVSGERWRIATALATADKLIAEERRTRPAVDG